MQLGLEQVNGGDTFSGAKEQEEEVEQSEGKKLSSVCDMCSLKFCKVASIIELTLVARNTPHNGSFLAKVKTKATADI